MPYQVNRTGENTYELVDTADGSVVQTYTEQPDIPDDVADDIADDLGVPDNAIREWIESLLGLQSIKYRDQRE